MAVDYYKVLGVDKNASQDDIKKAFRTLAHKYHPDKPHGDAEKFREINEAYQVLSDAEKKRQYDSFGTGFNDNGGPRPGSGGFGGAYGAGQGFGFDFSDFGDIFSAFSGFNGGNGAQEQLDQSVRVVLTFSESFHGASRSVRATQRRQCHVCNGSRSAKGSKTKECKTCNGKGSVRRVQETFFGRFENVQTCQTCHGAGTVPENPCGTCHGTGVERIDRTITFNIPPGIEDGQQLRLQGEGEQLADGKAGDLYVVVSIEPERGYRRDGMDIRKSVKVSWRTAILGGSIDVDWLGKTFSVDVPSGTQPGDVLRMKGQGFPSPGGKDRGHGYLDVAVELPKKVNKKQRQILLEWE